LAADTERPFAITWLDGRRNANRYTMHIRACRGDKSCADVMNVEDGFLETIGPLTLIGYTDAGDEVFEIAPEGRELRTPIPYMERLFPGDSWNDAGFPTQPTDFYAEHPVIFIKDPLGRYQRFLLRKYWAWC